MEVAHDIDSQTIWACQVVQRGKLAIPALELSLSNGVVHERTGSAWGLGRTRGLNFDLNSSLQSHNTQ